MNLSARRFATLLVALAATGCQKHARFSDSQWLGGALISADTLNEGAEIYEASCASCHGTTGAGDGPQAHGMSPSPRNLQDGLFEFAWVPAGQLPTDADLIRTIRHGLLGTAMVGREISESDASAVAQYIKTFSPRWIHDSPGKAQHSEQDLAASTRRLAVHPKEEWIANGRQAYYFELKCWSCHPAYVSKEYLYEASGRRVRELRPDLYKGIMTPSAFGESLKATDFLTDVLRAGNSEDAIFRAIKAGLGGTAMARTGQTIDDARIWATAYYVRSLIDLKEQGKADALRKELEAQANWQPGQ